jgi:hypothetical protein
MTVRPKRVHVGLPPRDTRNWFRPSQSVRSTHDSALPLDPLLVPSRILHRKLHYRVGRALWSTGVDGIQHRLLVVPGGVHVRHLFVWP